MSREQHLASAAPTPGRGPEVVHESRGATFSRAFQRQFLPGLWLVLVCAYYLLLFYWLVVTALKTREELLLSPPTLWPTELAWSSFRQANTSPSFATWPIPRPLPR